MLVLTNKRGKNVTSRLKKISLRVAHIFYDSNHLQTMASRLKKIFPRLTHLFFDMIHILGNPCEQDDYQMNLKKICTSYVFLLKVRVEDRIITTDIPIIKKLVVVGDIFS